jgi:predicted HAD superfamily phosphohydrolase YqeG
MHSRERLIRFVAQPFDEMAKRKKRIATVTRKLGILINCRVQKPFLKDLDAYRKSLKLSRPAALVKLATEHLAGLKEPAEKQWEGAVERMFPEASGVKGDDPK